VGLDFRDSRASRASPVNPVGLVFRDSQDSRASLVNPVSLDFRDSQASRASLVSRAALAGTKGIRCMCIRAVNAFDTTLSYLYLPA
jgi:hypothetical protein